MKRPYQGISDAQANALALGRRDLPYTAASDVSFRVQWDWHNRQPRDLREAVRMVRKAYSDEVPAKLHEGPNAIGEGGTPRMTARAEGYMFGSAGSTDAPHAGCTCDLDPHAEDCPRNQRNQPIISYYHAPFRAALANMFGGHTRHERGYACGNGDHRRAAIVQHVTIGSQGPQEAAIAEGVPAWCAKVVAEDALRGFLRSMTDIRIDGQREERLANEGTAA